MLTRTITSIFFDGQFWVAEIERRSEDGLETARHCFGAEPNNAELLHWVDSELPRLRFHRCGGAPETPGVEKPSPKRARRLAALEAATIGFGSKAQEAMRVALEQRKKQRRADAALRREEERERRWSLRRSRAKARRGDR
jgi:hypothetical protein